MESLVFNDENVTEEEKSCLDQVFLFCDPNSVTASMGVRQDALSRQIAVFDFKGSVRITAASVFISGIGPLGVVSAISLCRVFRLIRWIRCLIRISRASRAYSFASVDRHIVQVPVHMPSHNCE